MKKIAIIGGGPAALMLAAHLDTEKFKVSIYEQKKAVGRKFLVAGEGGLNLTYNAPVDEIITKYDPVEFMEPIISQFTNADLIGWFETRGISTFIGSSHRIFPDLKLKPIEVLNAITEYIVSRKVKIELEKKWTGWNEEGHLLFEELVVDDVDILILALGGASWKVTGSDGSWSSILEERAVEIKSFRAVNCAFGVAWTKNFIRTHRGKPIKNIAMIYEGQNSKGELCITEFGLEGNAIYALSHKMQEALNGKDSIIVYLDLKPTLSSEQIRTKLKNGKSTKITDLLKEELSLDRASIGLLKQFIDKDTFLNIDLLSEKIKSIPISLLAADQLDRAISTVGGISLKEIDVNFQIKKIPNTYAIGEMLDWFAPTGGYLLQACFSMGSVLAKHLNEKA